MRSSRGIAVVVAAVAAVAVCLALAPLDDSTIPVTANESFACLSCPPTDRTLLLGLDDRCLRSDVHPNPTQSRLATDQSPAAARVVAVLERLVALFLLCGECVVLGAALFASMVYHTPGVRLGVTRRATHASALGLVSAMAYHVVCLGWYVGRLDLLHVVWAAPTCQALLTVAVALLYAAVVDRYDRNGTALVSQPMARFG